MASSTRAKVEGAAIAVLPVTAFPTIFAAAFGHPDEGLRRTLRERLDAFVVASVPRFTAEEIRAHLAGVEGTVLEPFVLTEADIEMAATLVQLAFSERFDKTRVRIVSRETIGEDGGLVITNHLRSYYAERFSLGKHRHSLHRGWRFVPSLLPRPTASHAEPLRHFEATMEVAKARARIVLPLETILDRSILGEWLQPVGRVYERPLSPASPASSFAAVGLNALRSGSEIRITTVGLDARQRLLALCATGAFLGFPYGGFHWFIALHAPLVESVPLRVVRMNAAEAPWLRMDTDVDLPTSHAERLAIARWLPFPIIWLDDFIGGSS